MYAQLMVFENKYLLHVVMISQYVLIIAFLLKEDSNVIILNLELTLTDKVYYNDADVYLLIMTGSFRHFCHNYLLCSH